VKEFEDDVGRNQCSFCRGSADSFSGFHVRNLKKCESVLELCLHFIEPRAPTVKLICEHFQGVPLFSLSLFMK